MRRLLIVPFMLAVGLSGACGSAKGADVIVQGTTDVRDAGLLDDVIVPGFHAAYPQYTLKYIAVGTGQALTNARAGQGDAVLTHAPTQEADFVRDGYSYEKSGRAIFYSDYVIIAPASDPAGVRTKAPHDAAKAFELIAAAGAQGKADFVSRGDNSGTNTEEKIIWGLGNVAKNAKGEPGSGTSANPSWYHKAGLGQASTVQLASQCPFSSRVCYDITDRGTFNRLVNLKAVTNLVVVADKNAVSARGSRNLLVNSFHAYAVNPSKVSKVNLQGALAFLNYLQSVDFQARLASYPNRRQPAFFADARPNITVLRRMPRSAARGDLVTVTGSVKRALPGGRALTGAQVRLVRVGATSATLITTAKVDTIGRFTLRFRARFGGLYRVVFPAFRDLTSTARNSGRLAVTSG
jgi:tungstate transport system substrate-binding protein